MRRTGPGVGRVEGARSPDRVAGEPDRAIVREWGKAILRDSLLSESAIRG
jgi:hypothetical protein